MDQQSQISAYISERTRTELERYAEEHGLKKGQLIETALLHHLQALRELPSDVIIPPQIVLSRESGERLLDRVEKPGKPTPAMVKLMKKYRRAPR